MSEEDTNAFANHYRRAQANKLMRQLWGERYDVAMRKRTNLSAIVEDARAPWHPWHNSITWDDEKAAAGYINYRIELLNQEYKRR